jgi:hypothetical protein
LERQQVPTLKSTGGYGRLVNAGRSEYGSLSKKEEERENFVNEKKKK